MQSHICARFLSGLMIVSSLITPAFAVRGTVTAGGDHLRVRAEANTSSAILTRLADGTHVEITDTVADGTWYQIAYNGISGYVSAGYMTMDAAIATPAVASVDAVEHPYVKVDCSSLNVRSGPDASFSKVGSVRDGVVLEVLDETNGWYRVANGYVCAKYTVPSTREEFLAPPVSKGQEVVDYARTFLGSRYVYGGSTPSGFDCSGFTSYVYAHFGYKLNRSSAGQMSNGVAVDRSELQPGDLMFFKHGGRVSHVGIYVGGNRIIHASTSRTGVIISDLSEPFYAHGYCGARRVL